MGNFRLTDSRKTHINNVEKTTGWYFGIGYKGERSLVKTLVIIMRNFFRPPLTHGMECDILFALKGNKVLQQGKTTNRRQQK